MNRQQEEYFVEIPKIQQQEQDEQLFAYDLPQPFKKNNKQQSFIQQKYQDCDAIDDQLLRKTSQLHQSLRNKKLLEFQLLEAKIMKKDNFTQIQDLQIQLEKIQLEKESLPIQGKQIKKDIILLKKQVQKQKQKNQRIKTKIEQSNHKIVKRKQELQKIKKNSKIYQLQQEYIKEHGYISVEKIKLEAENQSKKEIIEQIKKTIQQLKDKLLRKQELNQNLQEQYQQLLKEMKKKDKKQKIKSKKSCQKDKEQVINVPTTFREDEIEATERSYFQKENIMNKMNIPLESHSKSLSTLKTKQKSKKDKSSTELRNKVKVVNQNCLQKWIGKGTSQPKRMY